MAQETVSMLFILFGILSLILVFFCVVLYIRQRGILEWQEEIMIRMDRMGGTDFQAQEVRVAYMLRQAREDIEYAHSLLRESQLYPDAGMMSPNIVRTLPDLGGDIYAWDDRPLTKDSMGRLLDNPHYQEEDRRTPPELHVPLPGGTDAFLHSLERREDDKDDEGWCCI